eukprot:Gregarina_sp_Poly_1__3513@NODE_2021_length_2844_cov_8_574361_g1306_i0_p1_GENE_NODE_2021_length_2844_cov_8_574361_g1306_i0NODE_2021_length_2844_cov_8_574361_g1306_i0_p1_ORF_typecomplete_len361_score54_36_NODE_2021_length_2844_cov_8_574361_g1306_i016972779
MDTWTEEDGYECMKSIIPNLPREEALCGPLLLSFTIAEFREAYGSIFGPKIYSFVQSHKHLTFPEFQAEKFYKHCEDHGRASRVAEAVAPTTFSSRVLENKKRRRQESAAQPIKKDLPSSNRAKEEFFTPKPIPSPLGGIAESSPPSEIPTPSIQFGDCVLKHLEDLMKTAEKTPQADEEFLSRVFEIICEQRVNREVTFENPKNANQIDAIVPGEIINGVELREVLVEFKINVNVEQSARQLAIYCTQRNDLWKVEKRAAFSPSYALIVSAESGFANSTTADFVSAITMRRLSMEFRNVGPPVITEEDRRTFYLAFAKGGIDLEEVHNFREFIALAGNGQYLALFDDSNDTDNDEGCQP